MALHAVVRGLVQGVGFRFYVLQQAKALGLSGWVRNCADGSVELSAEGDRAALEALLTAVQTGPRGARVDNVDPDWPLDGSSSDAFRVIG